MYIHYIHMYMCTCTRCNKSNLHTSCAVADFFYAGFITWITGEYSTNSLERHPQISRWRIQCYCRDVCQS